MSFIAALISQPYLCLHYWDRIITEVLFVLLVIRLFNEKVKRKEIFPCVRHYLG